MTDYLDLLDNRDVPYSMYRTRCGAWNSGYTNTTYLQIIFKLFIQMMMLAVAQEDSQLLGTESLSLVVAVQGRIFCGYYISARYPHP